MGKLNTYQTWKENDSLADDEGKSVIARKSEIEALVTESSITDVDFTLALKLPTQTSNIAQSKNRQSHQLQQRHHRELMINQTLQPVH